MKKKFELLRGESIRVNNRVLYRIIATRDFGDVKAGQKGGYVEGEYNLSHDGAAWIYDEAKVYGTAEVSDDARILDEAIVKGSAKIKGKAEVSENAIVDGPVFVFNSKISGSAKVLDFAEIINSCVRDYAIVRGEVKAHCADISGRADVCDRVRLEGKTNSTAYFGLVGESAIVKVYGNARVYGDARIFGNAEIFDNASVYGNAHVYTDARIFGNARVFENSMVYYTVSGDAYVLGHQKVYRNGLVF